MSKTVWLIHLGEVLPIDGSYRLFRNGILAQMLADHGHRVVQWAPTFSHITKTSRATEHTTINVADNYRIELLHAGSYRRHVGLQRMRFHRKFAAEFLNRAPALPRPDVILCSLPTPNMCTAALDFAEPRNIPVVVDVRDLWPEVFENLLPNALRPISRLLFHQCHQENRAIFSRATGISGISDGFLDWGLKFAGRPRGPQDGVFALAYPHSKISDEERAKATAAWDARGVGEIADGGPVRLSFFGTFGRVLDPELVISAAKTLAARGEQRVQFVLCGSGDFWPRCAELAKGLPNVILPGWVDASQLKVLMERSHVGLIPYKPHACAAIPNKAIDCFAAGLPIITTAPRELATLLHDHQCGLTYEASNENSFIDTVLQICEHPAALVQMQQNARQLHQQRFDVDFVYGSMISYLEAVATSAQGRHKQAKAA